jgi:platelet-activating factor acetylhydrolase
MPDLPISRALLLDPWLQPTPEPGPIKPHMDLSNIKMAAINSETFTLWKDHLEMLFELMKEWNDMPLYTIRKSQPTLVRMSPTGLC